MHVSKKDTDLSFESFRYRAYKLDRAKDLRLCGRCLRHRRRCYDSMKNITNSSYSWKAHRERQYRAQ
jgi:hypothetical protein